MVFKLRDFFKYEFGVPTDTLAKWTKAFYSLINFDWKIPDILMIVKCLKIEDKYQSKGTGGDAYSTISSCLLFLSRICIFMQQ